MDSDGCFGLFDRSKIRVRHRLVIDWSGEQCTQHRVVGKRREKPLGRLKLALWEHGNDVVKVSAAVICVEYSKQRLALGPPKPRHMCSRGRVV